ncbi:DUF125-domain-containing protein [Thozetella sp. PMI_491]|nr:DUF125-domain-containing protein [Thozetella sp. PMI_491]
MSGVLQSLGLAKSGQGRGSIPLPMYSPIAPSESSPEHASQSDLDSVDEIENDQLHPAQRHSGVGRSTSSRFELPSLARFLADFTLGFADGLTVPFALTAGLSSLGQTDTVIYAGMAEICAGSISMGIGGYLSAKGEVAATRAKLAAGEMEEDDEDEEKGNAKEKTCPAVASDYLAPLDLPPHLMEMVVAHIEARSDVLVALESKAEEDDERLCSPIIVGLSVSIGYLLGGLLPLFPYFIVSQVGDGLLWSFVVCIIALFVFGFAKDFVLHRQSETERWNKRTSGIPWADIRRSTWEGTQMVILGSVAAVAAVLCVRAFESFRVPGSNE